MSFSWVLLPLLISTVNAAAAPLTDLAGRPKVDGVAMASPQAAGRVLELQTNSGQTLRVTAYGDGVVRVQAIGPGQTFFENTRYEMVAPENHQRMAGRFQILDPGLADALRLTLQSVQLEIRKNPVRLVFRQAGREALAEKGGIDPGATPSVDFVFDRPGEPAERFAGLGHPDFGRLPDGLDLRGRTIRRNRSLDVGAFKQAPLLVPYYVSSRGYGVFVNSTFPNQFRLIGKENAQAPTEYRIRLEGGQMDYFFIAGPSLKQVLDRYTRLTGRPRMIPASALALNLSDKRMDGDTTLSHTNEAFWRDRTRLMHESGIPFGGFVHDNGWRGSKDGVWRWDLGRYPNPATFEQFSKAEGMTSTLDFNRRNALASGLPQALMIPGARETSENPAQAVEDFPDFTVPAVRTAFWTLMDRETFSKSPRFPGDFIWLDEFDFPVNPPGQQRNLRTWKENANYYFFVLKQAVAEGWDSRFRGSRRPYIISRGSTAGAQRFGYLWSGDLESTRGEMQDQIRGMLSAGLSGFPFWTHDAGGFFGDRRNPDPQRHPSDQMVRNWAVAMGSFTPVWRPHGLGMRWPDSGFSAEYGKDLKRFALLRMALFPYNYSVARRAHDSGIPMTRPMLLEHNETAASEIAWGRHQQYMWGERFLVAPFTDDGASPGSRNVDVWLPQGVWHRVRPDDSGRLSIAGPTAFARDPRGAMVQEQGQTGQLAMFVRGGSVIPMFKPEMTLKKVDRSVLELHVFPGENGEFEMIEDDYQTEAFLRGASRTIRLRYADATRMVTITNPAGAYAATDPEAFPPVAQRRYVVVFHGQRADFNVRVSAEAQSLPKATSLEQALASSQGGTFFDARKGTLTAVTRPGLPVGVATVISPSP
jgi:alpha-glucosidase (family GH31 glycosyl hydrolase)